MTAEPSGSEPGLDRWWTWPAIVAGFAICVVALIGAVTDMEIASPIRWAGWLLVPAVVHDFVWAAGVGIGAVLSTRLPAWMKVPFRVALGMTSVVLLIAWPLLGRYGERPDNATVLPFDYAPRIWTLLGVIWGGATLWALTKLAASRQTTPG